METVTSVVGDVWDSTLLPLTYKTVICQGLNVSLFDSLQQWFSESNTGALTEESALSYIRIFPWQHVCHPGGKLCCIRLRWEQTTCWKLKCKHHFSQEELLVFRSLLSRIFHPDSICFQWGVEIFLYIAEKPLLHNPLCWFCLKQFVV